MIWEEFRWNFCQLRWSPKPQKSGTTIFNWEHASTCCPNTPGKGWEYRDPPWGAFCCYVSAQSGSRFEKLSQRACTPYFCWAFWPAEVWGTCSLRELFEATSEKLSQRACTPYFCWAFWPASGSHSRGAWLPRRANSTRTSRPSSLRCARCWLTSVDGRAEGTRLRRKDARSFILRYLLCRWSLAG